MKRFFRNFINDLPINYHGIMTITLPKISVAILIGGCTIYAFTCLKAWLLSIACLFLISCAALLNNRFLILLAAFCFGIAWSTMIAQHKLSSQISLEQTNKPVTLEGIITDISKNNIKDKQLTLKLSKFQDKKHKGIVKLSWYNSKQQIKLGEKWRFVAKLHLARAKLNPGSRDREFINFQKNIIAIGKIATGEFIINNNSILLSWRQHLYQLWQEQFTNTNTRSLLTALGIGALNDLTAGHWQILQNTGTSHLMAISGLHIGLSASLGFMFFSFIWRLLPLRFLYFPAQNIGALAAIICAFSYSALAGFSVPTIRACIMIACIMLGYLNKKKNSLWQHYFLALLIVFLVQPLSTATPGFWLSFGSVGLILYCITGRKQSSNKFANTLNLQIKLSIGLLPLSLIFFQESSLISPLSNLIAIPWVSMFIVPPLLIGIAVELLSSDISKLLWSFAELNLNYLWQFLELLSNISPSIEFTIPEISYGIIACIGVVYLLMPNGTSARWLGLVFFLPLFFMPTSKIPFGTIQVNVLDVGQGLAIVLQTNNHVLVYDTGPAWNNYDSGKSIILPFLRYKFIKKINTMIISHPDNDHMGGAKTLLASLPIERIYINDKNTWPYSKNALNCRAGQSWEWDGVIFKFLHPKSLRYKKRNEDSCVLQIISKNNSFLLTGDIGKHTEKLLIKSYNSSLQSNVLIVPHHGSKYSSSNEFIEKVAPKWAMISAGYRNIYNHPHKDVLLRYLKYGVSLLSTIDCGAIQWQPLAKNPSCYRLDNSRFWR